VTTLLVDTDVFVDHLRGARQFFADDFRILYSVVTRCELFAGRQADERTIDTLLAAFDEIAVDRTIAEAAGRLRRNSNLRTPDALIAATALEYGARLVTRNERDFQGIPGLQVFSPA
jgi:predicted nucleic acid-binding protein